MLLPQQQSTPSSTVGFALSPAGLLLPYHVGVLESLQPLNIVAGSSAGAIAAAAHGCGLTSFEVLEATVRVSDACGRLGGARGRILPFLEEAFDELIGEAEFAYLQQQQETMIGIAYQRILPSPQSYLQTSFTDREDLLRAIRRSCMFPFFSTNGPCLVEHNNNDNDENDNDNNNNDLFQLPHCYVDGFFSVPRERFGCPILDDYVERTVGICHLPQDFIGVTAFSSQDCIAPNSYTVDLGELIRIAVQPSSRQDLYKTFERGIQDGEAWCRQEVERETAEKAAATKTTTTIPSTVKGKEEGDERAYAY